MKFISFTFSEEWEFINESKKVLLIFRHQRDLLGGKLIKLFINNRVAYTHHIIVVGLNEVHWINWIFRGDDGIKS